MLTLDLTYICNLKVDFMPDLKPRDVQRRYEDDSHAPVGKCFYAWHHARVNPYGATSRR